MVMIVYLFIIILKNNGYILAILQFLIIKQYLVNIG